MVRNENVIFLFFFYLLEYTNKIHFNLGRIKRLKSGKMFSIDKILEQTKIMLY